MRAFVYGFLLQIAEITSVSVIGSLLVSYALFSLMELERIQEAMMVAFVAPLMIAPSVSVLFGRSNYRLFRKQRALERAAQIDEMTRLLNRRAFMGRAERVITDEQTGRAPWLLYVDVDHFKCVNDTYGHPAGDAALQRVAEGIRTACRGTDLVGRIGGEEFAVLVKSAGTEGGILVAERIRAAIAAIAFDWKGSDISLSVSVGAACWQHGDSFGELVEIADQSLYYAKTHGRNRVATRDDLAPARPAALPVPVNGPVHRAIAVPAPITAERAIVAAQRLTPSV